MTILERIGDAGVFNIYKGQDGRFELWEACDTYYSIELTREEVLKLAEELKEFVEENP